MKKNKATRLMALLLIAVLMTTSVVGSTLAKYITVGTASDTARVAKWGVTVTADTSTNPLFKTQYNTRNGTSSGGCALDVQSSASDNVVAPGTEGYTSFQIKGTPEVASEVTIAVADGYQAISLPAGTYKTTAGEVIINDVYEPIKWYFGTEAPSASTAYTMSLAELKTAASSSVQSVPNTKLDKTFYVGWQWAFENDIDDILTSSELFPSSEVLAVDVLDTILGDAAAGIIATPEGASLTESIKIGVIVKQIEDYGGTPAPADHSKDQPESITVTKADSTKVYKEGDPISIDDLNVTGKFGSDTGVNLKQAGYGVLKIISPDPATLAEGDNVVTVSYTAEGKDPVTGTITINAKAAPATDHSKDKPDSITVTKADSTKVYQEGDSISIADLKVTGNFGTDTGIDLKQSGFGTLTITAPASGKLAKGDNTVTVSYKAEGKEPVIGTITINAKPAHSQEKPSSIDVTPNGGKVFSVGETLSADDFVITGTFGSDTGVDLKQDGFGDISFDPTTVPEDGKVTVKYTTPGGETVTKDITLSDVKPKHYNETPTSISATVAEGKTFTTDSELTVADFVITGNFGEPDTAVDITKPGFATISINPTSGLTTGDNEITITYKSKTTTVTVKVPAPIPEGATIVESDNGNYVITTKRYKWDTEATIDREGVSNSASDLDGKANTDWMLENTNLGTTEGTIWKFCADVRAATGNNNWYVPSVAELNTRYKSDSSFRPGSVWSSSESSGTPAGLAYMLGNTGVLSSGRKDTTNYEVLFLAS